MKRAVRTAAAVGALALALSGCGSTILVGQGRPAADVTGPGDSTAPGDGSAAPEGGSPAPTASAAAGDGKTVTLGKITIPLTGVAKATKDGAYLCLTLVDDSGCSLEVIDIGATRAAGGSVSTPAPGEPNGWWWGSDVPTCGSGSDTSPVTTSKVVEKGFKPVGSKTAAYASWLVSCQNPDLDFDPRMWWLPKSQVAFREHDTVAGAGEAVDKLLAGVTFGS
ncbi:MAG TPA: hypothetical protein VI357_01265 [Mycobacteriales bacterium]